MTLQQLLTSMHAVSISGELREDMAKAELLAEIKSAATTTAQALEHNHNCITGTVFPRGRPRFRWLGRDIRVWRLDLKHPLWLGEDGIIYRGYEVDTWDGWEFPYYLLPAEIEQRDADGLRRVLRAVHELPA